MACNTAAFSAVVRGTTSFFFGAGFFAPGGASACRSRRPTRLYRSPTSRPAAPARGAWDSVRLLLLDDACVYALLSDGERDTGSTVVVRVRVDACRHTARRLESVLWDAGGRAGPTRPGRGPTTRACPRRSRCPTPRLGVLAARRDVEVPGLRFRRGTAWALVPGGGSQRLGRRVAGAGAGEPIQ